MEQIWKILEDPTVQKVLIVIGGIILINIIAGLIKRWTYKYFSTNDARYKSRKVISFASYLIIVLFITIVFYEKLGGLTVALGVAGAGVAFALQEVIASLAGWIAVSFGGFYSTGDRVQLGGIKGDVIDIGVLRTTLMELGEWIDGDQYSGRIVRIANSFVFKEPVFNYSQDFPFVWDEVRIPIAFGSDYDEARKIVKQTGDEVIGDYAKSAESEWKNLVRKYLIEDATIEPMVTMTANDTFVLFTLRYIVDFKKRRSTKDRLFTGILNKLNSTENVDLNNTAAIVVSGKIATKQIDQQ